MAAVLAPETEARMEELRRVLAWGDHFRLLLIGAASGPARETILQRLRAWSGRDDIPVLVEVHLAAAERPVARIRQEARNAPRGAGLVVLGLDQYLTRGEQATPAIQELNFFRDELPEALPGPLVLIAAPDTITHLLGIAPDFVSVRALTLDIEVLPVQHALLLPPISYIAELESRTESPVADATRLGAIVDGMRLRASVGVLERAEALVRFGQALVVVHDYDGASQSLTEALHCFDTIGDSVGQAICQWSLGEIARQRSDSPTARLRIEAARALFCHVGDTAGEASCFETLGLLAIARTEHGAAQAHLSNSFELHKKARNAAGQVRCLLGLGQLALQRSDHETARGYYEAALALCGQVKDAQLEAHCVLGLGDIAKVRSDDETAKLRYEDALRVFRRNGNDHGVADSLLRIGNLSLARAAKGYLSEALVIYRVSGIVLGEANCLFSLSVIAIREEAFDEARVGLEKALHLFRRIADRLGQANCIQVLGELAAARSDLLAAEPLFQEARALFLALKNHLGRAGCCCGLGDLARRRRKYGKARSYYNDALRLFRRVGSVIGEANCLRGLADVEFDRSELGLAQARYQDALALMRRAGDIVGEAGCMRRLGDVALRRMDRQAARAFFEEALRLYRQIGSAAEIEKTTEALNDIHMIE